MKTIRIGTRDSQLAVWQANWVKSELEKFYPELQFELVPMKTKGDKILDVPLSKIGDKGLFTKELEQGLLNDELDMAVHSLKDMPTKLPDGLTISAFCVREEPRDVFLSKNGIPLEELPLGAMIGTSSLRRKAQLKYFRPDLQFMDLRGNLQTRWEKLQESEMDGIVLAAAGVKRLGWEDRITQILPEEMMLSAVGQGSVAIEIVERRSEIQELLSPLNHNATEQAVRAERALMRKLEGGCQVPIGALAQVVEGQIVLRGMVASLDGVRLIKAEAKGIDPETVGIEVANRLVDQGALTILAEIR
ncbi:hydroxymethylbilane synthase [Desulfosporosinus sp. BICA1-9]|uniref:hydroxymethylbilane synthase n=1 Tax=Desulfosporosinus sp. BICA1-9 TaxID=1531958 RepID=UPI00054B5212|nr:hydroxymethylbilane synthase [Desulfosporosinus sp. BICA1-9]KJS46060.1 MAG: hydroxymethylbilane synthase [Peptococcaceae bacterium BRH_c23]KJS90635.1 MAG: hydroxymethylbilane synthase [Desulfosporosinus sp. BICA1-9]HBW34533.1 hydroxymethylbilane synthase [Desulfosporosinus sp.]